MPFGSITFLDFAPSYRSGSPIESGFIVKYLSICLNPASPSWCIIRVSSTYSNLPQRGFTIMVYKGASPSWCIKAAAPSWCIKAASPSWCIIRMSSTYSNLPQRGFTIMVYKGASPSWCIKAAAPSWCIKAASPSWCIIRMSSTYSIIFELVTGSDHGSRQNLYPRGCMQSAICSAERRSYSAQTITACRP